MSLHVTIAGAALVVLAVGLAYRYATSGGDVSVDVDGDGNPEVDMSSNASSGNTNATPDVDTTTGGNELKTLELTSQPAIPSELYDIEDLTEIKGIGETRADALTDEGYPYAEDLWLASDEELTQVDGIGQYTVDQIREDIGGAGSASEPNAA